MKKWLAVASLGVVAGFAVSAVADDNDHGGLNRAQRVFRAELVGFNEVPSVSTAGHGRFYAVLNQEETELTYWISFSGLTAPTSQSHIHVGQHHTNGGISVWLCEGSLQAPTASTPSCGPTGSTEGEVMGVLTSAEVIGPAGQGIAATEFAELIEAMRHGAAYANVHSVSPTTPPGVQFPNGEIRGQIN
jgi:CHRD domain-containing protein